MLSMIINSSEITLAKAELRPLSTWNRPDNCHTLMTIIWSIFRYVWYCKILFVQNIFPPLQSCETISTLWVTWIFRLNQGMWRSRPLHQQQVKPVNIEFIKLSTAKKKAQLWTLYICMKNLSTIDSVINPTCMVSSPCDQGRQILTQRLLWSYFKCPVLTLSFRASPD